MPKTLIVVGSNSSQSINYDVANQLKSKTQFDLIWLKDYDVPMYSMDMEKQGIPQKIKQLENQLNNYETIVLFTPEHNGYLPSFLKNIFDWLSRDFDYKDGAYLENQKLYIVSVSPGETGGETVRKLACELLGYSGAEIIGNHGVGNYQPNKNFDSDLEIIKKSL